VTKFGFTPRQQTQRAVVAAPRRLRFFFVAVIFAAWAVVIAGRLVWLQVGSHADFVDLAMRQQQRTFQVAPRRGVLYDRNLHELAMTVLVDSVYGVPNEIRDKAGAARALARVVHTDPTDKFTSAQGIATRLRDSRNFAWIARKLDPATTARVKALNLKGIYFQKEFKRFYPNNQLAAQVLGYVGTDDNGLGGMERKYDAGLHGAPGRMLTALDARRKVLGSEERDPLAGENLQLTIDENIQFMAERALDHAMEKTHAVNGTAVVQDPHTGQILALAIRPTFNPNDFRHATTDLLRNHAVSDVYEPGSTFKLVTISAALDQHLTTPNEVFDCQEGRIVVAGRLIHDWHPFGALTTTQILEHSSDVGSIKIGLRLGPERFYDYIRAYGFGQRSGVEMPAETRGLVKPPKRWQPSSIGSVSMGQEVAVTPLQLITMVSTIANGGLYLPPHILLGNSEKGDLQPRAYHAEQELPNPLPPGAHRVISEVTAGEMRRMMQDVVLEGTGKPAQLNGYSAGGKSGTAQKIDVRTHTYSKTKYIASFAGFAPVNNPAVSIAVILDSPEGGHHGGQVGGPVFAEVAQEVLEYLGVQHDQPLKAEKELLEARKPTLENNGPVEQTGDLNALFAEVNDLPADDPLRAQANGGQPVEAAAGERGAGDAGTTKPADLDEVAKADAAAGKKQHGGAESTEEAEKPARGEMVSQTPAPEPAKPSAENNGALVTDGKRRVAVPSFAGESVRGVVEKAGTAGLGLQLVGSGLARDQAPAAGTMVPLGTEVVVRFGR
jgi:cell division protein FtsI (penicillin-binding protein 3)